VCVSAKREENKGKEIIGREWKSKRLRTKELEGLRKIESARIRCCKSKLSGGKKPRPYATLDAE